jgi:acyl-CoA dehydrogenase
MRSIGAAQVALDTMIERVTDPTRKTFGKFLYEHGQCLQKYAIIANTHPIGRDRDC